MRSVLLEEEIAGRVDKHAASGKELDKAVPIGECIGTACLPETPDKSGSSCKITGWGTLMSSGASTRPFLTSNTFL